MIKGIKGRSGQNKPLLRDYKTNHSLEYTSHFLEQNRLITLRPKLFKERTVGFVFFFCFFFCGGNPITKPHIQNDRWLLCIFFLLCIFLNGSTGNFPNITVWLEKVKQCHSGGRRGRKGKDSEKGLCFLIKVRCRTDFVSLKEHTSFSPSVVLSSIGGSEEVPWR